MRTIEEIFKEAERRGLAVSNLFQLMTYPAHPNVPAKPTGQWQANFRTSGGWYDFGRGNSAAEALEDALARATGKQGPENRPIPREAKPVASLDDLC